MKHDEPVHGDWEYYKFITLVVDEMMSVIPHPFDNGDDGDMINAIDAIVNANTAIEWANEHRPFIIVNGVYIDATPRNTNGGETMKMYRMEYINNDDIANEIAREMGWYDHDAYTNDTGGSLIGLWHPIRETEHNSVVGWNTRIDVVCVVDGRAFYADCPAIVTSYGVYVNVGDYIDAIS